jgi:hypothetical protein
MIDIYLYLLLTPCAWVFRALRGTLVGLVVPPEITDGRSIAQALARPVGISPYLVASPLGRAPENP